MDPQPEPSLQRLLLDLPRSHGIERGQSVPAHGLVVAYGYPPGHLPSVSLVNHLDEPGERVGLPGDEELLVEGSHVALELHQVKLKPERAGSQQGHLLLQIVIADLQRFQGGGVRLES